MDQTERGQALLGYVVGLAFSALALGAAAGALTPAAGSRDAEGAVRLIAVEMRAASWRALQSGRDEGFLVDEEGSSLLHLRDRDGDGLRLASVRAGHEEVLARHSLRTAHPGARLGSAPRLDIPVPPAGPDTLDPNASGVRFGADRFVRFSAAGHASPGSLLVRGRHDSLCALIVSGAGARVRTYCFDTGTGSWRRR